MLLKKPFEGNLFSIKLKYGAPIISSVGNCNVPPRTDDAAATREKVQPGCSLYFKLLL